MSEDDDSSCSSYELQLSDEPIVSSTPDFTTTRRVFEYPEPQQRALEPVSFPAAICNPSTSSQQLIRPIAMDGPWMSSHQPIESAPLPVSQRESGVRLISFTMVDLGKVKIVGMRNNTDYSNSKRKLIFAFLEKKGQYPRG